MQAFGHGKRQLIAVGTMNATVDGMILFPGNAIPDNSVQVPVLFCLKRYQV